MSPRITVSESGSFIKAKQEARSKYSRIDQSVEGIMWRLSRSPEDGDILGPPLSPDYRILSVPPHPSGIPRIWVRYKIQNNHLTLLELTLPDVA